MIRTGSRLRQIGWAVALSICVTGFVALTFRVNAVKSEVRLAEREIIALEREKLLLETEFQTRANQQQLANWNRVEFGYGLLSYGSIGSALFSTTKQIFLAGSSKSIILYKQALNRVYVEVYLYSFVFLAYHFHKLGRMSTLVSSSP